MIDPQLRTYMTIIIVFGLFIFFIPSIIAFCRKAERRKLIFGLNLFFGLSFFFPWMLGQWFNFIFACTRFVFWCVALIWACAEKKEEKKLKITGGENE